MNKSNVVGVFLKNLYVFLQSRLLMQANYVCDVILGFQNKQICCFGSFLEKPLCSFTIPIHSGFILILASNLCLFANSTCSLKLRLRFKEDVDLILVFSRHQWLQ